MRLRKKKDYGKQVTIEHCHACDENMRISLDLNLNGQHEIKCPHCSHPHYRIIKNGKITQDRYDVYHQGPTYSFTATAVAYDATACTSSSTACYGLWQFSANDSTGGY